MRRPYYVPQGGRYVPSDEGRVYGPSLRWRIVLAALLLLAFAVLTVLLVQAWPAAESGRARFVAPSTYGPPGPSGGVA